MTTVSAVVLVAVKTEAAAVAAAAAHGMHGRLTARIPGPRRGW